MNQPIPVDGLPPERRFLAMLALGVAVSMAVLDGSIANIALPTIADEMHATPAASIWVVNAYQLAVTISLLPLASLGDVHGHRRIYCWGLLLYTHRLRRLRLSPPPCPNWSLGRVLQGFGGAGIMSVNGALIRFIFPRAQLGRGIGYNVLVVATASAAGPSVAAAILAVASWPWLFAIQVPFGIVSLLMSDALPAALAAVAARIRHDQRGDERDHARACSSPASTGSATASADASWSPN